jgi:hypothetical protein
MATNFLTGQTQFLGNIDAAYQKAEQEARSYVDYLTQNNLLWRAVNQTPPTQNRQEAEKALRERVFQNSLAQTQSYYVQPLLGEFSSFLRETNIQPISPYGSAPNVTPTVQPPAPPAVRVQMSWFNDPYWQNQPAFQQGVQAYGSAANFKRALENYERDYAKYQVDYAEEQARLGLLGTARAGNLASVYEQAANNPYFSSSDRQRYASMVSPLQQEQARIDQGVQQYSLLQDVAGRAARGLYDQRTAVQQNIVDQARAQRDQEYAAAQSLPNSAQRQQALDAAESRYRNAVNQASSFYDLNTEYIKNVYNQILGGQLPAANVSLPYGTIPQLPTINTLQQQIQAEQQAEQQRIAEQQRQVALQEEQRRQAEIQAAQQAEQQRQAALQAEQQRIAEQQRQAAIQAEQQRIAALQAAQQVPATTPAVTPPLAQTPTQVTPPLAAPVTPPVTPPLAAPVTQPVTPPLAATQPTTTVTQPTTPVVTQPTTPAVTQPTTSVAQPTTVPQGSFLGGIPVGMSAQPTQTGNLPMATALSSENLPPMRSSGGGGTSAIDPTLRPYLELGLRAAEQQFLQTRPEFFPGQTYVSPSQQTLDALAAQEQIARTAPSTLQAAQESYMRGLGGLGATAQGAFLGGNPFLQQAMQAAVRPIQQQFAETTLPGISSMFSGAGRYGSGAMERALGRATESTARALGDVGANLAYTDYASERGRQQQAMGQQIEASQMAPQIYGQQFLPSQQLAQIGAAREAIAAQPLQEQMARFQFAQQAPTQQLQSFLSSVYGTPMAQSQYAPTPEVQTNRAANVLGLGALGGGIGSMIAGQSGAFGYTPSQLTAFGAGLGALGGLLS